MMQEGEQGNIKFFGGQEYFSLQYASTFTPHSQEYLRLLARQKKLQSRKLGRNWYTTREALMACFGSSVDFGKAGHIKEQKPQPAHEPALSLRQNASDFVSAELLKNISQLTSSVATLADRVNTPRQSEATLTQAGVAVPLHPMAPVFPLSPAPVRHHYRAPVHQSTGHRWAFVIVAVLLLSGAVWAFGRRDSYIVVQRAVEYVRVAFAPVETPSVTPNITPVVSEPSVPASNSLPFLDTTELTLDFVTLRGNVAYRDVRFTRGVTVQGGLTVGGSVTIPEGNLRLGSGTIEISNSSMVPNLNAEYWGGRRASDYNLIYPKYAGSSRTTNNYYTTGGGSGTLAVREEGGIFSAVTSLSFSGSGFDVSSIGTLSTVRLDWTNGPASRSQDNTWTALNVFSVGASVSGGLEVSGTASVSQLYVNGSLYAPLTGMSVTSNSLDFDEFVNAMNLDADTSVASNGFSFGFMGNVGIGTSTPTTNLDVNGSIAITGLGARILGDFSSAIFADRVAFQSNVVNGNTNFAFLPNGSSGTSAVNAYNNSDPTNASFANFGINPSGVQIAANRRGTGAYLPIIFQTNGTERMRITASGSVGIGTTTPLAKLQVVGNASVSTNFEASGYASSSALFGSGLANCTGKLLWSNGLFSCGTDQTNAGTLTAIAVREGTGTFVRITSISFNPGVFDISNTGSESFVKLDWTNGPASRAMANTWTALNIFSAGASVSTNLEISGTASVSQLYVNGSLYAPFTGMSVTSNSLDFDEFVNTMKLDSNLTIYASASGSEVLTLLGSQSAFALHIESYRNSPFTHAALHGRAGRGTNSNPLALQGGDQILLLDASGYDGSVIGNPSAQISFAAAQNFTIAAHGTNIDFLTTASGSTTLTQRMRLSSEGNLGIGTTTPDARLDVAGNITASASGLVDIVINATNAPGSDGKWTLRSASSLDLFQIINGAGTGLVNIASNGNIGIGATNTAPAAKLVFANTAGSPSMYLFNSGAGVRYGSGIQSFELQSFVPTNAHFSFNAGGDFQTSGVSEIMRIMGTGNVGIGDTTPDARLDVTGSAGNFDVLDIASSSGISLLRVTKSGNVGIGTTNPVYKLAVAGTASVSGGFFGAGLTSCSTGTAKLLWNSSTGMFSCGTDQTGGGTGTVAIALREGYTGAFTNFTSLSFDAGKFNLDTGNTDARLTLDWTNGPASRATANTWTALNVFSSGASVSTNLEVSGTASVSQLYVNGSLYAPFVGQGVTSNSLDFDEFVNAMNLDANLTVASGGYTVDWQPFFASSLSPSVDDTYSLGDPTHRWRDVYVGPASIHIGIQGDEATIAYDPATDRLTIDKFTVLSAGVSLSGSANLEVSGTASAAALFGAGLTSCSNATNDKLLWNSTTGMFSCGTDQSTGASGWADAGATVYLSTNTDSVGIGTQNVDSKFELVGQASISGDVVASQFIDREGSQYFMDPAGAGTSLIVAGNTGIGTTTANSRLQVVGTNDTNGVIRMDRGTIQTAYGVSYAASAGYAGTLTNTRFDIRTNNSPRLTVSGGGFVGVGTVLPSTLLEIQGTASASYLLAGVSLQVAGYSSVSYSRLGTGTTTHALSVGRDLLITGLFEVDSGAFFDANASISGNLETVGYASASQFFGSGLSTCNGTNAKLLWNNGVFSCGSDNVGTGSGALIGLREGFTGVFTNFSSISFNDSHFTLDLLNADARVYLDWGAGGPASRALANTWTALNVFSAGASVGGTFEVSGTASVSALRVGTTSGLLKRTSGVVANAVGSDFTGIAADEAVPYLVLSNTSSLSFERALAGTTNQITLTDGGVNSTLTLALAANLQLTNASASVGEFTNFASASKYYGGGLVDCNASQFLQYSASTGRFGCDTPAGGTGGTLQVYEQGGTANTAASLSFAAAHFDVTYNSPESLVKLDWGAGGPASLSQNEAVSGRWTFSGGASFSASSLEISGGYASVSQVFGAGLSLCSSTQKLQYSNGTFSCATDVSPTALKVRETGGTFQTTSSLSFAASHFNISFGSPESIVRLDWTNGPASRAANEAITGRWAFNNGVSVSGPFELSGAASISGNMTIAGNVLPRATDTFDLGSSTLRWRDLYLASGSLHIGVAGDDSVIDYNVNDDYLAFKPNGTLTTVRFFDTGDASVSGALEVGGRASASAYFGGGLMDCDINSTDKLLWDSATGSFACGIDQSGSSTGGHFKVLDRNFSQTDVTNTAAETTIYTYTIPGNFLGSNGGVRLWLGGTVVKNISNGSFTVRAKLGGTTIADMVVTAGNNAAAAREGGFTVLLQNAGTAASQKAYMTGSFSPEGNNSGYEMTVDGYGTGTVDTTVDRTFTVTIQPNSATTALAWTKEMAVLESADNAGTSTFSGSGSAGQLAFWTNAASVSGDNNLFWNNSAKRLGVGTGAPTTTLEVQGTASASYFLSANALQIGSLSSVSYSRFGGAATTHGITAASDLLIAGVLEVDSPAYFDGNAFFAGTASVAGNLEVAGVASVSQLYIGGTLYTGAVAGRPASDSLDFDEFANALTLDADTTVTNNGFALTLQNASVSGDLELAGSIFGAGLTNCSGSGDKLLWSSSTGQFSCGADQTTGGGAGGSLLNIREYGVTDFGGRATLSFERNQFALAASGSNDVTVRLDWTNGPASRAANSTITGTWEFRNTASFSNNVFLTGTNVGIGTNAPAAKLHVVGGNILIDNTRTLQAKNSAGTIEDWMWPRWSDNVMYTNFGANGWNIRTNGSANVMFMKNDGNVGIGTIAPVALLDVRGAISTTGTLTVTGTLQAAGSTATTYSRIGTGVTTELLGNPNDLLISGRLEVDNDMYADADLFVAGNLTLTDTGSVTGAGLSDCDQMSQKMTWDGGTGLFGCSADISSVINVDNGQTLVQQNPTSIDFNSSHFVVTASSTTEADIALNWGAGGPASLSQDETVTGHWLFGNGASWTASSLEVTGGYASVSQLYGASLAQCAPNQKLEWANGVFSCVAESGAGIRTELDGVSVQAATDKLNFTGAHFLVTASGSTESVVALNWGIGGPASLSQDEVVSGSWAFANHVALNATASISGNFGPVVDATSSLGSAVRRFKDLYLSGSSLHIGSNGDEAVMGYDTATQAIALKPDGLTTTTRFFDTGDASVSGTLDIGANLKAAGYASASALFGAGLTDCDGGTAKMLWDASTGMFSCGTDQGGRPASNSLDFDELADTLTLDANTTIASNGFTLTLQTASISGDTYIRRIFGSALPNCNQESQTLLYQESTGTFLCGSDDNSAGAGGGGWTDDGTAVRLTGVTDDVGIGTVSPNSKLHIVGDAGANDMLYVASANAQIVGLMVNRKGVVIMGMTTNPTLAGTETFNQINKNPNGVNPTNTAVINDSNDLFIQGGLEVGEKVFFGDSASVSDNLEIGEGNVNKRLYINAFNFNGTSLPNLANAQDRDTGLWWDSNSGPNDLYFTVGGNTTFWLDSTKNVGIGTWAGTNPATLTAKFNVFADAGDATEIMRISSANAAYIPLMVTSHNVVAIGGNVNAALAVSDRFNQINDNPNSFNPANTAVIKDSNDLYIHGGLETGDKVFFGDSASVSDNLEIGEGAVNRRLYVTAYNVVGTSLPNIANGYDRDTGIWWDGIIAPGDTYFTQNGTTTLWLDDSKNVGIGSWVTRNPAALNGKLMVYGDAGQNAMLNIASSSGDAALVVGPKGNLSVGVNTNNRVYLYGILDRFSQFNNDAFTNNPSNLSLFNSAEDLFVNGAFEVGDKAFLDGTASVGSDFEVGGRMYVSVTGTLPQYSFSGDNNTGLMNNNVDELSLWTNGVSRLRILPTGNIGIGTTTPTAKLDVTGDVIFREGLQVAGTATVSYSRLGTVAADNLTQLDAANDLMISGALEVDGKAFFDSTASVGGAFQVDDYLRVGDAVYDPGARILVPSRPFTAADPQYSFIGDTDTGMYLLDNVGDGNSNTLLFSTGGTERIRINSNGNVGIGTLPTARLHIEGSGSTPIMNVASADDLSALYINKKRALQVGMQFNQDSLAFHAFANNGLALADQNRTEINSDDDLFMEGSLEVNGILDIGGAASVGGAFEISGGYLTIPDGTATLPSLRFQSSPTTGLSAATTNVLALSTAGSERMRIDATGNVGIGTTAPNAKLDVNGDVIFRDVLQAGGTATVSYSRLGTGTTTHALSGANNFLISGLLEVDGASFLDSTASIATSFEVGSDLLTVKAGGNVGIATAAPAAKLDVQGDLQINISSSSGAANSFALCHTSNGATSNQFVIDCGNTPASDFMEMYPFDTGVEVGMIVAPSSTSFVLSNDNQRVSRVTATSRAYDPAIMGVMSDIRNAGDFNSIGYNLPVSANAKPVALTGRVRVRVSLESGPIRVGDHITSSDTPGIGMRATRAGQTVGMAIEPLETVASGSYGEVMVFVNVGYWAPTLEEATAGTTLNLEGRYPGLMAMLVTEFRNLLNITFDNGLVQTLRGVFGEVQTDKLCVGSTCVNEQQLQQLLEAQGMTGGTPAPTVTPTSSVTPAPGDTPTPTPTPSPTPDASTTPVPDVPPPPPDNSSPPEPLPSEPPTDPTPAPVPDTTPQP